MIVFLPNFSNKKFESSILFAGVGRSISTRLANMNVHTCKELQDVPLQVLQSEFGNKMGQNLQRLSIIS